MTSAIQRPDLSRWSVGLIPATTEDRVSETLGKALTRGFMPLARNWRQALDHELLSLGLSGSTGWTLMLIDQLGDEVRQTDLASGLDINSASVVRLVDALVAAGFVDRRFDKDDRRVRRVGLTAAGRDIVGKVEIAVASFRRRVLAGVSEEDLAAALRVSRQIGRALENGPRL